MPLVAIYPEEGTLYSDNPLYVLDAEWVSDDEAAGAEQFIDFVQRRENQEQILRYGFRPGNPEVSIGSPIDDGNGVDPDQPQTLLEVPEPEVLTQLLDDWQDQRKPARVLLLIDVSGSMSEVADPDTGATKLDLAKQADHHGARRVQRRRRGGAVGVLHRPRHRGRPGGPVPRAGAHRPDRRRAREPQDAGPRPAAPPTARRCTAPPRPPTRSSSTEYDPTRINAVVLLSDGVNDDGEPDDDRDQLEELLSVLSDRPEGEQGQAVRVFPISYGENADLPTLRRIAEASQAALYDSSDPRSINKVFVAVVSNF